MGAGYVVACRYATVLDAEGGHYYLNDRADAVGRAGGVCDYLNFVSELVFVATYDDIESLSLLDGSTDDYLLDVTVVGVLEVGGLRRGKG